jgi:hypothetical protein
MKEDIIEGNKLIAEIETKGYRIDANGDVWVVRKMKLSVGKNGYKRVNIFGDKSGTYKTHSIHRLVALKYLSNPFGLPEVNHKDGNKLNNHVSNLEWCDRSANILHGYKIGLITKHMIGKSGSKHPLSKIVLQLDLENNIVAEFGSAREAAQLSKINYGTISNVLIGNGKTAGGFIWKYKN